MATLKFRDTDGVWQVASSLKYKDASGIWQTTRNLKYKDNNGVWQNVRICRKSSDSGDDYPTISTLTVGSTVYLNENGSPVEYLIVHKGLPDNTLYDSSCNGVWLLRKDIYESRAWNATANNNYSTSSIHTHLNDTFFNLFNDDIKSLIKSVKVPYGVGGGASTVNSGANGVSTKIFLPSSAEVGLYSPSDYPVDGASFEYFNGASNALRVAKLNGVAAYWWLRSPAVNSNGTYNVWVIMGTGATKYSYAPTGTSYGVRPCLILPYAAKLDPNTNTIIG